jgi:hypothetical protein
MVAAARVASKQSTFRTGRARSVRDFNEKAMIENRPYRSPYPVNDADAIVDRRSQLEREQQEQMAERQKQIALQTSPFSSAEERVRLWEKLHELALPRSPTHKLLRVIAEQTELAMEQVLEIQQQRFARPALPVAVL